MKKETRITCGTWLLLATVFLFCGGHTMLALAQSVEDQSVTPERGLDSLWVQFITASGTKQTLDNKATGLSSVGTAFADTTTPFLSDELLGTGSWLHVVNGFEFPTGSRGEDPRRVVCRIWQDSTSLLPLKLEFDVADDYAHERVLGSAQLEKILRSFGIVFSGIPTVSPNIKLMDVFEKESIILSHKKILIANYVSISQRGEGEYNAWVIFGYGGPNRLTSLEYDLPDSPRFVLFIINAETGSPWNMVTYPMPE